MKEKRVNNDIPFFPQEIIRNILKRLPAKTLIRFQCVCREWRNLFRTKSFIADQLDHSSHQKPCLIFQSLDRDNPWNLFCLDSEMQVWEFQNPPLLNYFRQGKIVGSSNGLLCVQINNPDVSPHFLFLWNPSTREVRLVPEINFHRDYDDYYVEFGFSPIVNDYKIVIAYVSEYDAQLSALKVYSLSSGSWREVKFRLNCTACLSSRSVTVNGVMFWLGSKGAGEDTDDDEPLIVSFDLANEVFTLIATPELHLWTTLTVYEEKLAIVSCLRNSEYSFIDLWVMEEGVREFGERRSWTKKYTCSPYPCGLYPRTIWKSEIVCRADVEYELTSVLFNPTTRRIKKHVISKCDADHDIFHYAESLVPVGGMKSFTTFL